MSSHVEIYIANFNTLEEKPTSFLHIMKPSVQRGYEFVISVYALIAVTEEPILIGEAFANTASWRNQKGEAYNIISNAFDYPLDKHFRFTNKGLKVFEL